MFRYIAKRVLLVIPTLVAVAALVFVDLFYAWLDPRIHYS